MKVYTYVHLQHVQLESWGVLTKYFFLSKHKKEVCFLCPCLWNFSLKCSVIIVFIFFSVFQCVLFHHAVADCAVVGQEDALKGHVPFALCVLREGESSMLLMLLRLAKVPEKVKGMNFFARYKDRRGEDFGRNCWASSNYHWSSSSFPEGGVCATATKNTLWQDTTFGSFCTCQWKAIQGKLEIRALVN